MWANNEVGTVTDIPSIVKAVKKQNPNVIFHSDAGQAVGKVDVDLQLANVDFLTIIGHKIGAPKGISALVANKRLQLKA